MLGRCRAIGREGEARALRRREVRPLPVEELREGQELAHEAQHLAHGCSFRASVDWVVHFKTLLRNDKRIFATKYTNDFKISRNV